MCLNKTSLREGENEFTYRDIVFLSKRSALEAVEKEAAVKMQQQECTWGLEIADVMPNLLIIQKSLRNELKRAKVGPSVRELIFGHLSFPEDLICFFLFHNLFFFSGDC